ncbi:hypothetical protein GCM10018952_27630 [Streptosporangium vulgare]
MVGPDESGQGRRIQVPIPTRSSNAHIDGHGSPGNPGSQLAGDRLPGYRGSHFIQSDGTGSLVLSIAEHPESADRVVESEGARIFLDPQVVDMLDDKSLDADIDEGGGVAFLVTEQLH